MLRQPIFACLLILGTCVVIAGCTQVGSRPNGPLALLGKKHKSDEAPPTPAPALYIPGPVASAPAPLASPLPPPVLTLTSAVADPPTPVPPSAPIPRPPPAGSQRPTDPSNPLTPLRELYEKAAAKFAAIDSYTVRLRRREVVGNDSRPEEVLLFKWRREPWSVYFKWLGTEGKGREVVYVKGRYDNLLHTLTAAGDVPLLPAGKRFKVSPDGILVKSKSRYPITEAGIGTLVERFGKVVAAFERGDGHEGTVKYLGQLKRPEYENKVDAVLQTIPPKSDPHLPRGGQRLWFFDTTLHLPMLLITQDDTGREVEYYCHDRFMYPVNLTDDDFNPDVLWKASPPR